MKLVTDTNLIGKFLDTALIFTDALHSFTAFLLLHFHLIFQFPHLVRGNIFKITVLTKYEITAAKKNNTNRHPIKIMA